MDGCHLRRRINRRDAGDAENLQQDVDMPQQNSFTSLSASLRLGGEKKRSLVRHHFDCVDRGCPKCRITRTGKASDDRDTGGGRDATGTELERQLERSRDADRCEQRGGETENNTEHTDQKSFAFDRPNDKTLRSAERLKYADLFP